MCKRSLCGMMLAGVAVLCAGLVVGGCAVNRPTQSPEQLSGLLERYTKAVRSDTQFANETMLARIRLEEDEYLAATASGAAVERPTFDILILSGGGDFGAFGAGVLAGWGQSSDPMYRRPTFDLVTGVSTGALIAPFAYLGDDKSYEEVRKLYTAPKDDWFVLRGLLFFLPGNESFLRNDGLKRDLREHFDEKIIRRLAKVSAEEHRVLAVNATNLDVGAIHPFFMGRTAQVAVEKFDDADPSNNKQAGEDFRNILLASTAIPAVFPPVVIDGALYVDGGVTSNILYGFNWRAERAPFRQWMEKYPGEPLPKIRFWVIVNNQLDVGPQTIQPQWMEITKASMGTAIRASTSTALRHLATQVALLKEADKWDVEFRYISIPTSWVPPNQKQFDKDVMNSLSELGARLGRDAGSWKSDFR